MNDLTYGLEGFTARRLDGRLQSLADFAGLVLLIVNTASQCGFTPQYASLESLYRRYRDQGFTVLGFPCNQFRQQEPGTDEEIGTFCTHNFGVTFPMFAKIKVNGKDAHPLYHHLKSVAPGVLGIQAIKWNFTKFLVGREGRFVRRYAPVTVPEKIAGDIEALL